MRPPIHFLAAAAAAALLVGSGCSHQAAGPRSATVPGPGATAAQEVTFAAADGWVIHADFTAAPGGTRAAVLLHQRNGSAGDWEPLVPALLRAGISALAIDQRGAGRSTGRANGDDAPWDTMRDVAAAVGWLRSKGYVAANIGLVGASYGANNALIYAAAHPDVPAVVLLSPGSDYHGLRLEDPARGYKGTVLVLYSQDDTITENGPALFTQGGAAGPRQSRAYPGAAHGTDMLRTDPGSIDEVAAFLKTRL